MYSTISKDLLPLVTSFGSYHAPIRSIPSSAAHLRREGYNHYKRLRRTGKIQTQKSNVLLLGPTDSGKTYNAWNEKRKNWVKSRQRGKKKAREPLKNKESRAMRNYSNSMVATGFSEAGELSGHFSVSRLSLWQKRSDIHPVFPYPYSPSQVLWHWQLQDGCPPAGFGYICPP